MRFLLLALSVLVMTSLACGQAPAPGPAPTPAAQRPRPPRAACEVHLPTAQSIQAVMSQPDLCGNETETVWTIIKVKCKVRGGRIQFFPHLTGQDATSILTGPIDCGETWTLGVLNGQPRVASYAASTAQCLGVACSVDFRLQENRDAQSVSLVVVYERQ